MLVCKALSGLATVYVLLCLFLAAYKFKKYGLWFNLLLGLAVSAISFTASLSAEYMLLSIFDAINEDENKLRRVYIVFFVTCSIYATSLNAIHWIFAM